MGRGPPSGHQEVVQAKYTLFVDRETNCTCLFQVTREFPPWILRKKLYTLPILFSFKKPKIRKKTKQIWGSM